MTGTEPIVDRRLPIGAEVTAEGVHFRVWAPKRRKVAVAIDGRGEFALAHEGGGYFAGGVVGIGAGTQYRFRLDDGHPFYADPASRFQPEGPHGLSEVVDAGGFKWTDAGFPGVDPSDTVLYELHVGTFTEEGTWRAAIDRLPALRDLGITCIEVLPVNECPGRWNWGYDGVNLFAPTRNYGRPDDMRAFVDRAHALGIAVILDVVYNHFGPDGNHVGQFTDTFFSTRHKTNWGTAINFDGEGSDGVREFFLANAKYWIDEFHVDGYRFDATQAIFDDGGSHILRDLSRVARKTAGKKRVYLISENEPQHTVIVRPESQGGHAMDALWNDDFHHSAFVALTGRSEAYLTDYLGRPQELLSAMKYGYLFQGQRYKWQGKRRGTPALDLPPSAFVNYIQNHDQIANFGRGHRIGKLAGVDELRAMTMLLLLAPQTPMLFQGQEWAASTDFNYFTDMGEDIARLIRAGRIAEITQFESMQDPAMVASLLDPSSEATFRSSKLRWAERDRDGHAQMLLLTRELIRIRRNDPVLRRSQREKSIDGAVLGHGAMAVRFFGQHNDDRLLLHNQDGDEHLFVCPEPLLAAPEGKRWEVMLSSEEPRFGGHGVRPAETKAGVWHIPGRSAQLLRTVDA